MFKPLINSFINFSPLEQFDDISWVASNRVFEGVDSFSKYVFELEYDFFSLSTLNGKLSLISLNSSIIVFGVLAIMTWYSIQKFYASFVSDFSHVFLLAFIHILTSSVLFFWFDDFISDIFVATSGSNSDLFLGELGSSHWKTAFNGDVAYNFIPQINFSISFDENLISFLIAFLFLSGSEGEDDQDFILEEEESDFIGDIVAPIIIDNLGKNVEDNGALFLKASGIFGFVLINNIMGMLPYSDTGTSSLILTFWVSLGVFGSIISLMFRKHGVNYLFGLLLPSGLPVPLLFLLVPIEFLSYSFRLVSLSVRLFANMMAGHTLFKVLIGFSWSMVMVGDIFLFVNLFPLGILFILTFLEMGIALVQAYIFTLLTCMYLKDVFVSAH
jgi:ATP synthase subunit 6